MELLKKEEDCETFDTNVYLLKNCPLCNSSNCKPIKNEQNIFPREVHPEVFTFSGTWSQLLKCNDCSFAFTKEIPSSPTFFDNRYDNGWFNPEEEVKAFRKSIIVENVLNTLLKYRPNKGLLLDVGSFAGKLLFFADKKGFTPEGVEVNPKLAKYSKEKLGYEVWCCKMQNTTIPSNRYDCITIIDVLEHLVDPIEVLKTLHRVLKKDGILYIKVPNAPMQILKQNIANRIGLSKVGVFGGFGHINHFSVKSLNMVSHSLGFEVCEVQMAESEYWHDYHRLYLVKNFIRKCYFKFSNFFYKVTGIPIGLNLNIILKKL